MLDITEVRFPVCYAIYPSINSLGKGIDSENAIRCRNYYYGTRGLKNRQYTLTDFKQLEEQYTLEQIAEMLGL